MIRFFSFVLSSLVLGKRDCALRGIHKREYQH